MNKASFFAASIALLCTVALPTAQAQDTSCNAIVSKDGTTIKTKEGNNLQLSDADDCAAEAASAKEPTKAVAEAKPAPVAQPVSEPVVITIDGDLAFGFDQANISPSFEPQLRAIAQRLKGLGPASFDIIGFTDNVGSETYNQALSERRAEAVAAFLINAGIDGGRLAIVGRGEEDPIDTNDTDIGRANNRRVEIHSKPA